MPKKKPLTIAIDWDDTLWSRSHQCLMAGAQLAVQTLREHGCRIVIYSCNAPTWIRQVCDEQGLVVDEIWGESPTTGLKPLADVYVDDKGLRHESWAKTLQALYGLVGDRLPEEIHE
jgi:phosphoserine phosphatase